VAEEQHLGLDASIARLRDDARTRALARAEVLEDAVAALLAGAPDGAQQHHSTQQGDLAAGPHGRVIGRADRGQQPHRRVSEPAAYVRPSTAKRSPCRSQSTGMLAGSISSPYFAATGATLSLVGARMKSTSSSK
jgi:hypothetical protein